MYRGYLHYSYNETVGLNVVLWDRSGESEGGGGGGSDDEVVVVVVVKVWWWRS